MPDDAGSPKADAAPRRDFAAEAARRRIGFASELWFFLRHNKRWWITPIVVVLLLVGLLVILGGTAAAPFLYPLF